MMTTDAPANGLQIPPPPPPGPWWEGVAARWWAEIVVVAPAWFAARLLVIGSWVLAATVVQGLELSPRPNAFDDGLLAWDAAWYRDIVRVGYDGLAAEGLRFFPLFPFLASLIEAVTPLRAGASLLLVSNSAALGLSVALRRLVLHETGDDDLARRAVWLMNLLPPAFVLVWGYSESLMLLLAVACFSALRRERWRSAAMFGALAALARPLGLFLVVPAAIEVLAVVRSNGDGSIRRLPAALSATGASTLTAMGAAVAGPVLGTGAFLGWVWIRYGDPLLPVSTQGEFRGEAVDPITRLVRGVTDLGGGEALGDGLHLPWAVGFLVLLIAAWRLLPTSYGAFATVVLIAALSADNLNSLQRYGLNAFPLTVAAAHLVADPRLERATLAIGGAGVVALSTLSMLDAYVP